MKTYLLEFHDNLNLKACKIQSNTPKEAVETCMKRYKYPCNVINTVDVNRASVRVTLIDGKRKVISYYIICYTGFKVKSMSAGLRRGIGKPLTDAEIEQVKQAAKEIKMDVNKLVFNDVVHVRTCYWYEDDRIYIGSDVFPDTKSASTNPIDLLSVRAVLAHEYYGHRPRRQQYLDEENKKIPRMEYWRDEYLANYNAAKNAPGLTQMDRYHLIQSAIRRCEEAGVFLERDEFIMEVLYGTSFN